MADILTIQDEARNTLINRGLSLDLRSINYQIQTLFRRYTNVIDKIQGGNLIGKTQFHQIQDSNGISIEYGTGRIVFKNGLDKIDYLIKNRKTVAESLGIDSGDLYDNRRDNGLMLEYLSRLDRTYDIGQSDKTMQMYISIADGNSQPLNFGEFWIDYIMTRDWIDDLTSYAASEVDSVTGKTTSDHRIEYLSDTIQNMVKYHEILFHKDIEEFDGGQYVDKVNVNDDADLEPETDLDKFNDAAIRLNSMNSLEYGFYEMFKPIGGTDEKYVKVKLSTNGDLDISGVVGLSDCEHVEWEYGSMEYLRSLNTGNQRYDFKLSIPFNDLNSVLWWRPDEPERLEVDEEKEGEITDPTGYRYYKPYETERFLRWFGTNYIPLLDPSSILKKTVCSAPMISNDVQFDGFYQDATNITSRNMDLTRVNVDGNTSLSLLSLANKSTIDVIVRPDGQYARFVVGGHQQTSNIAFHLKGKMYNAIQEMNHFSNTWKLLRESYISISKKILILTVIENFMPGIDEQWRKETGRGDFIPDKWIYLKDALGAMQRPNMVDLLRFRQIDVESISSFTEGQFSAREEFIGKWVSSTIYENIIQYVSDFSGDFENNNAFAGIPMEQETKEVLLRRPLLELYWKSEDEDEQKEIDGETSMYQTDDFGDLTVDELRDRIETFNNLIVRLPVDTYHNKVASRHIFLDWRGFVDGAVKKMVENGKTYEAATEKDVKEELEDKRLYVMMMPDGKTWLTETGRGTDNKDHEYTEVFIDKDFTTPLVDYSYCVDDDGNIIHDRFDFWTEDDFR